ncbi:MAG: helix-turn-helix domain-containing protein [Clostridiales bacterium]|nr:helix-turn-helix domain-containing protein [Clostridiales bacterium]
MKIIIAKNITAYRKAKGLTQNEVAQKLNYTDKAVSKWERAGSVPDVMILKQLADLFGVTLNDLTTDNGGPKTVHEIINRATRNKFFIPILSALLVWLAATAAFVFLRIFDVDFEAWLVFVYALPCSFILLIVFNAIWGNNLLAGIIVSMFIWSALLSVVSSFFVLAEGQSDAIWQLLYIGIPLQLLIAVWYIMRSKRSKK